MILGDSLVVMNSLLRFETLGEQVQMIYMDPPYGVRFGSNFQPFVRKRDVVHGDDEDMTREPEMVQAYRDIWKFGLHTYLAYLRDRFLIARELLNDRGSIFVQISDENMHHVRELLDEVFGVENFVALIAFKKTGYMATDLIPVNFDYIVWFAKKKASVKFCQLYADKMSGDAFVGQDLWLRLKNGDIRRLASDEAVDNIPEGARLFRHKVVVNAGFRKTLTVPFTFKDRTFHPGPEKYWSTTIDGMNRLAEAERLIVIGNSLRYINYLDDFPVSPLTSNWTDTVISGFSDPKLYVVQTNSKVIQRCMLMTTDPGDLVLDPTCGSGTTAFVAEQWGRRWITIDTSRVPLALARQRLLTSTFPYHRLADEPRGPAGGFIYRRKQNRRGEEVGGIVPHVTLKSIAKKEPPDDVVLVRPPRA